jgi:hypothetical protein
VIGFAFKVALALTCTALGYFEVRHPSLHMPPHFWHFIAVFFAAWALAGVTSNRIVRETAKLIGKLSGVLLYWNAAFYLDSTAVLVFAVVITTYVALGLLGVDIDTRIDAVLYRIFARIFGERERMADDDRAHWAQCETVADLGRVCADYLEGKIRSQPAYQPGAGVDDETAALVPVLAAANRAGFCTTGSQPGTYDGYAQNAYVTGYVADYALLDELATAAGLNCRVRRSLPPRDLTNRGRIRWGIQSAGNIESFYGEVCSDAAVTALLNAYQVVIEDPEAGRDDRVWQLLAEFTARRTAAVEA